MPDEPGFAAPERYIELAGFDSEWRDLWWNADYLALTAERFGLASVTHALDVGCGAGHWTRTVGKLLAPDARLVGLDREPAFLSLAREAAGANITLCAGHADALPFTADTFDLVTCQTVLIHVRDVPTTLREMLRVLRRGGLLILAEPDNLAGNLAHLNTHPPTPVAERLELVRLQALIEEGKRALGEGDSSIGALLPGLLAAAGADDIRTYTNDRCLALVPPYASREMQIALTQELGWARDGISTLFGAEEDARRYCLAGGGGAEEFDALWAHAKTWMAAFRRGVEAGTYHAARGYVGYIATGRKP